MRLRYFVITSIVLLLVSLFSLSAHNYLANKDHIANIDALLRQTAATLMHADWANPERNDLQRVESILAQELGSSEINRFFILRDGTGKILYKSRVVGMLGLDDIQTFPNWVRIIKDDWHIRVFNLTDYRFPDRLLQVGLILSTDHENSFNDVTLALLFFSVGGLGVLSSWLLSGILFRPISKVGQFLATATNALDSRGTLPNVPKELFYGLGKKDELRLLTQDLDSLLNKINTNYKTSRLWAAQMAHELKTPLSQLLLHLETTAKENDPDFQKSVVYIETIKNTINAFLDWAELENSANSLKNLEPVSIRSTVGAVVSMFPEELRNRITINTEQDFMVACNANHFSQMAQNLISNALKYSDKSIVITIRRNEFIVTDSGPGLPSDVMEKLGDPFNFGNSKMQKKGHGLGLAWINTICQLYGWTLKINSTAAGTQITVEFLLVQ